MQRIEKMLAHAALKLGLGVVEAEIAVSQAIDELGFVAGECRLFNRARSRLLDIRKSRPMSFQELTSDPADREQPQDVDLSEDRLSTAVEGLPDNLARVVCAVFVVAKQGAPLDSKHCAAATRCTPRHWTRLRSQLQQYLEQPRRAESTEAIDPPLPMRGTRSPGYFATSTRKAGQVHFPRVDVEGLKQYKRIRDYVEDRFSPQPEAKPIRSPFAQAIVDAYRELMASAPRAEYRRRRWPERSEMPANPTPQIRYAICGGGYGLFIDRG